LVDSWFRVVVWDDDLIGGAGHLRLQHSHHAPPEQGAEDLGGDETGR